MDGLDVGPSDEMGVGRGDGVGLGVWLGVALGVGRGVERGVGEGDCPHGPIVSPCLRWPFTADAGTIIVTGR